MRQAQPADRTAPIVVHGTERGPSPLELLESLDKAPYRPSPAQGLHVVLDLLSQATQRSITVNLAPEPEQGFPLRDGVDFEGVARHAYRHESPELNPLVSFGADGGFEGVVVGSLYRA